MTIPITDGDDFKNWFVEEAQKKYGLNLETKLNNLDSGPSIEFDETKNALLLKQHGISYDINLPKIESGLLLEGLACLYGYGICKYNYEIAGFQDLPEAELNEYKRLALELWDRNVHIDWMRSNEYFLHNGTKDLEFCKLLSKKTRAEKSIGIERHREQSKKGLRGDSDHHSITFDSFNFFLAEEIKNRLIEEMLFDQASITGRWYNKTINYRKKHKSLQKAFRDQGVYFGKNEYWTNPYLRYDATEFEKETWSMWAAANKRFEKYWKSNFGNDNKLWNPPCDRKILPTLLPDN